LLNINDLPQIFLYFISIFTTTPVDKKCNANEETEKLNSLSHRNSVFLHRMCALLGTGRLGDRAREDNGGVGTVKENSGKQGREAPGAKGIRSWGVRSSMF
jgi:hypothetical protein